MTRRQSRFEKRKAKREEKRAAYLSQFDNFDIICDRNNLFEAANDAKKHVMWKGTVQRWSIEQLLYTEKLHRDLLAGKDVRKGFSRFTVCERGKVRHISAVKFYERVVQKCLCQRVLYPAYSKSLIYDNSASQKGKGVKFAIDRMVTALRRHYKRYGCEGYALLVDFKGYFENINHAELKRLYRLKLKDERIIKLTDNFIDAYGTKGLGLGSETSQMHAIFYPNEIDHAITEGCKDVVYGRYMDDSFIIAKDKATIVKALSILKWWADKLKIILSPKKTMIIKLKNGVKWLKTMFYLVKGKIIKKPCPKSIILERRRLKKQIAVFNRGEMSIFDITQSFESWAGSMKRRNARRTVYNMRRILRSISI
ncbi:MAG: RNA-directed DNA polymerase [Alphaproteobacteria bacterium]|nr:RNA-directed DNA polymerase [Alphaproteobacteria bacterium]